MPTQSSRSSNYSTKADREHRIAPATLEQIGLLVAFCFPSKRQAASLPCFSHGMNPFSESHTL